MKIRCSDVCSFTKNIEIAGPDHVFEKAVWTDVTRASVNEAVDDVMLQASAVIASENGGEYLLQLGIDCGREYADATETEKRHTGKANAERQKKELSVFCELHGLMVRPGIISE